MKHTSTIWKTLAPLLLVAGSVACGAEAPDDLSLAQHDEALTKSATLMDAKTGGYVSTLRISRVAEGFGEAPTVILSGSSKGLQAEICSAKTCSDLALSTLTFVTATGVIGPDDLVFGESDGKGDIVPVDVDGILWVCKEVSDPWLYECVRWPQP